MSTKQKTIEPRKRRTGNRPWKHIYGVDRAYTERVDRLALRQLEAKAVEPA